MKSVFVFIATFLVATAASTGAKLVLAKPLAKASSVADSTKRAAAGDSVKTDTAIAVSGRAANAAADTVRPAGAPGAPAAPDSSKAVASPKALARGATSAGAPTGAPAATKPASGSTAAKAAGQQDTAVVASERRIAKVFTSMDAKQAAKVLEHMTDNDVEVILGYVGPRQAASIMSELPPERVATLSKLAIKDAQNGSKR